MERGEEVEGLGWGEGRVRGWGGGGVGIWACCCRHGWSCMM